MQKERVTVMPSGVVWTIVAILAAIALIIFIVINVDINGDYIPPMLGR
jgi:hypothetical protein